MRWMLVLLALHELDRVVDEVRVEVLDLLLRQLDLFEARDDLVVGEEPFLLSILDEPVEFLDVGERDVYGEHGPSSCGVDGGQTCRHTKKPVRSCRLSTLASRDLT